MPKNIDFSEFNIYDIIQVSRGKQQKTERQKMRGFSESRKYDIIQSSRGKQQIKVTKRISMLYLVKTYSYKYYGIV